MAGVGYTMDRALHAWAKGGCSVRAWGRKGTGDKRVVDVLELQEVLQVPCVDLGCGYWEDQFQQFPHVSLVVRCHDP